MSLNRGPISYHPAFGTSRVRVQGGSGGGELRPLGNSPSLLGSSGTQAKRRVRLEQASQNCFLFPQRAQGPTCLYLPSAGMTDTLHHTQLLLCVLGIKLKSSCLHSNPFYSAALNFKFI